MDLSISQLRMLKAVADAGTIAGAATSLAYTPSAVSQQMTALGRAVGSPVLERIGRGVRLTDVGEALVDRAAVILGEVEHAQAQVERLLSTTAGSVSFGYIESMTTSILVPLVRSMATDHPEIELHTIDLGTTDGLADVQSGRLDIGAVIENESVRLERPAGLEVEWLRDDPMHLIVPADSPIEGVVDLADLADEEFVMSPPSLMCGRMAWSAYREAGFEPKTHHIVDLYPVVLHLVAAGAGIALVPELSLGHLPTGLRVLPLANPIARRVGICFRSAGADRPALEVVLAQLRALLGRTTHLTPSGGFEYASV